MESNPTPDEAAAALVEAESSATRFASELRLPSYFHSSIGAAIAIQIATGAVGIAAQDGWRAVSLVAGLVLFFVVGVVQLRRFRRMNGARVWAVANRLVFGAGTTASVSYCLAFAAALGAALGGLWWLVPVPAVAGGVGYVLGGQRWLRDYRQDPASHTRGEGTMLALGATVAVAGLVLLVLGR